MNANANTMMQVLCCINAMIVTWKNKLHVVAVSRTTLILIARSAIDASDVRNLWLRC